MPDVVSFALGAAIAFLFAFITIYVDCYQVFRKRLLIVPESFWASLRLFLLALVCGLLAAGVYCYFKPHPSSEPGTPDWLDTLLGGAIHNPYLKGLYTGLAILTILRSKFMQFREIDVGLEYFYSEGRFACLRNISVEWQSWVGGFIDKNMPAALAIPGFDLRCQELITAAIQTADSDLKASYQSQLAGVIAGKPPAAQPDPAATLTYYRTLINLVLATCGVKPLVQRGFQR